MTRTSAADSTSLPSLPHWETIPDDLPAAIRTIKQALRARIARTGRTVEEIFAVIEARVRAEVDGHRGGEGAREERLAGHRLRRHRRRHRQRRAAGLSASARLPDRPRALRPRAGAGMGPRHRRLRRVQPVLRELPGPGDDFFGSVGSKPEIYPIYWSPRADAGPAERPHGHASRRSSTASGATSPTGCSGSTRTATRSTRTGSAAVPRAPLGRSGHPPRPGNPRPVDDPGLPAGVPAPVRRHRRAVRPVGRRPPHRRPAVPRARPCAPPSAPSRAGPRCRTWTTTRACCTPCRSPRRWGT